LSAYGESKKAIAGRMDKLDELRGRMEEAQRTEAVAAANFGFNSVEHKQAANEKRALEKQAAKLQAGLGADKYNMNREDNAAAMQRANIAAGSSAAHLAEVARHNKAIEGGMGGVGGKPMTANHIADMLSNRLKELSVEEKAIVADDELSPEEKEYELANIKGVRRGYQSQRLDFLKGKPVDIGYLTELEDVKNTPYSPQSISQPGAVVNPAPIGKTSVSNW
jgi:hypothetical protein